MLPTMRRSLIWRGALAIVIGVIAVVWPSITLGALVVLFAIFAFLAAVGRIMQAIGGTRASVSLLLGWWALAALDIIAGVVALAWPGITILVLVIWVAAWAVVTGLGDLGMVFAHNETAGERVLFALAGVVSVVLGLVLFVRPDIGAVSLAEVFGLFSIVLGVVSLAAAAKIQQLTKAA
jgi:uncharacterized membrane protein HdeD (DUF308 family)